MDKVHELLEVSMEAIEAILDYEALLLKPKSKVTEKDFKAVLNRMFTNAHRVMDMRLKNLQDGIQEIVESPEYIDWMRRN